ncbi:MAG TPA: hypothetical protein VNZ49_16910 [Bacteroidia bacterium]|jgi:hypothetical protein|nr:hypothetical protein [Bacteroidia bacterium]
MKKSFLILILFLVRFNFSEAQDDEDDAGKKAIISEYTSSSDKVYNLI